MKVDLFIIITSLFLLKKKYKFDETESNTAPAYQSPSNAVAKPRTKPINIPQNRDSKAATPNKVFKSDGKLPSTIRGIFQKNTANQVDSEQSETSGVNDKGKLPKEFRIPRKSGGSNKQPESQKMQEEFVNSETEIQKKAKRPSMFMKHCNNTKLLQVHDWIKIIVDETMMAPNLVEINSRVGRIKRISSVSDDVEVLLKKTKDYEREKVTVQGFFCFLKKEVYCQRIQPKPKNGLRKSQNACTHQRT